MEKSFGLRFFIRKSQDSGKENAASIYLKITVNGTVTEFSTKAVKEVYISTHTEFKDYKGIDRL